MIYILRIRTYATFYEYILGIIVSVTNYYAKVVYSEYGIYTDPQIATTYNLRSEDQNIRHILSTHPWHNS